MAKAAFIVWFEDGETALRCKDGRIVGSTKRTSLFTRREAEEIKKKRALEGKKTTIRLLTADEKQWAQGGFRTGSDWKEN